MDIISKQYSCCAVFVSYNPDHSFIDNVNQIVNQVPEVLIIDNNSDSSSKVFLKRLDENPKITVIYNEQNLGIATALNQGVKYAIERNYEWIATFDQDSKAPDNFIELMLTTYNQYSFKNELAIISPCYFDKVYGITMPGSKGRINKIDYEVMCTMTSGNLIKTSIFKRIGLFADKFFIDYVDNEFCLRCQINGLKIIISCDSVLNHNLGEITSHYFLGKTYFTTNHSPLRKFYKARNRLLLYRNYLFLDNAYSKSVRKWIWKDMIVFLKETVLICFFESNRRIKINLIFRGIIHGLQEKGGEYTDLPILSEKLEL